MEFLDFGKYAPYIWAAYGLTALVLIINLIYPLVNYRKRVRDFQVRNGQPNHPPKTLDESS